MFRSAQIRWYGLAVLAAWVVWWGCEGPGPSRRAGHRAEQTTDLRKVDRWQPFTGSAQPKLQTYTRQQVSREPTLYLQDKSLGGGPLALSQDGRRLVCAQGQRYYLWDVRRGVVIQENDLPEALSGQLSTTLGWASGGAGLLMTNCPYGGGPHHRAGSIDGQTLQPIWVAEFLEEPQSVPPQTDLTSGQVLCHGLRLGDLDRRRIARFDATDGRLATCLTVSGGGLSVSRCAANAHADLLAVLGDKSRLDENRKDQLVTTYKVRVWQLSSGRFLREFECLSMDELHVVRDMLLGSQGEHLVVVTYGGRGSSDEVLRVYDVRDGRLLGRMTRSIHEVGLVQDQYLLISKIDWPGGVPKTELIDLDGWKSIQTWPGSYEFCVADASPLFGVRVGVTIEIWDASQMRCIKTLGPLAYRPTIAWARGSAGPSSGPAYSTVMTWDLDRVEPVRSREVPAGAQLLSAWPGAPRRFVISAEEICVEDARTNEVLHSNKNPISDEPADWLVHPDSQALFVMTNSGVAKINATSGAVERRVGDTRGKKLLAGLSARGTYLLCQWTELKGTHSHHDSRLLRSSDLSPVCQLPSELCRFTFLPDESGVIYTQPTKHGSPWYLIELPTGGNRVVFQPPKGRVCSPLCVDASGKHLLMMDEASNDDIRKLGRSRWYDLATWRPVRYTPGWPCSWSSDGCLLASRFGEWTYIIEAETGKVLHRLDTPAYRGHFSHDNCFYMANGDIWSVKLGSRVCSLFHTAEGGWLVMLPDGRYKGSPGAERAMTIRTGTDMDPLGDYKPAFHKPRMVEAVVRDAVKGIRPAQPLESAPSIATVRKFRPPEIAIVAPKEGAELDADDVELAVKVVKSPLPIEKWRVYINDRLAVQQGDKGVRLGELDSQNVWRTRITLSPGANTIRVVAQHRAALGEAQVTVRLKAKPELAEQLRPRLFVLAIGVSAYAKLSKGMQLEFADDDARAVAQELRRKGDLFRDVVLKTLTDREATRANVVDNLNFLGQAGQHDFAVLFVSGHGLRDARGNYFFVPHDGRLDDDGNVIPSSAVRWTDIRDAADLPCRTLVLVDTCFAGAVGGARLKSVAPGALARTFEDLGVVTFASSRAGETSRELQEERHGAFTLAILKGLKGAADLIKDGKITMKELDTYVSSEVPKLTGGAQHPITLTPDGYADTRIR